MTLFSIDAHLCSPGLGGVTLRETGGDEGGTPVSDSSDTDVLCKTAAEELPFLYILSIPLPPEKGE